jgi:membrane-bound lytic murein transglycosylase MltF
MDALSPPAPGRAGHPFRTAWTRRRHWIAAALLLAAAAPAPAPAQEAVPPLVVDQYSDRYDDLFRHYANRYFGPFVDWRWFKAQAVAESMLDAQATSEAGARGVMQLLPSTFEEVSAGRPDWGDIHSPLGNIAAGTYYDRFLYRKWSSLFQGQDRFLLMLASYNAGFYRVRSAFRNVERVREWGDVKEGLPRETIAYVERIRELMKPQPAAPSVIASTAWD